LKKLKLKKQKKKEGKMWQGGPPGHWGGRTPPQAGSRGGRTPTPLAGVAQPPLACQFSFSFFFSFLKKINKFIYLLINLYFL
jgi:hypothetical protein